MMIDSDQIGCALLESDLQLCTFNMIYHNDLYNGGQEGKLFCDEQLMMLFRMTINGACLG